MSPGRGRTAQPAALASSRCAKGDQQMLSEESDLSHFALSDGVEHTPRPRLHAGLQREIVGMHFPGVTGLLRAVLLWAQQAQLEPASGSGTEEIKYYLDNTSNCITSKSHQW